MKNSNIFMTGNWENLIMSTYQVNSDLLKPYLPKDTEIDLYKGKALVSIVAFTFSEVCFFGIKIPCHQKFGQINFRFYVKSKIDDKKGVVFIKEFAPKPLIALTAKLFYNEPYKYKKINYGIFKSNKTIKITYQYKSIKLTAHSSINTIKQKQNTLEHFVVDRYIAFIKNRKGKTLQYKINHKPWRLMKSANISVNNDILDMMPSKFKNAKHVSSFFVDGSNVTVEKGIIQQTKQFIA